MDFPGLAGPRFHPDGAETGVPAGAATLILGGPVIARRPLPAPWQQAEPVTAKSVTIKPEAERARANG